MNAHFADKFGAGLSSGRLEDARLIRGKGCYAANSELNCLHAAFVRSPYPHAKVISISTEDALSMRGVHFVITGQEMRDGGASPLKFMSVIERPDGSSMATAQRWPLAIDEVHYVGDPIVLVVADSRDIAKSAAEAVYVEFDELPYSLELKASISEDAATVSTELQDNLSGIFSIGSREEIDAVIANAHHVTKLVLVNNRIVVNPMELRTSVVGFDEASGYEICCATQTPHLTQTILSESLGIPEERLRVIVGDVGGSFGARITPYPEDVALLYAAGKLDLGKGQKIKFECERSEQFLSDNHSRDHYTEAVLALDKKGKILAAKFEVLANLGAHVSFFGGNAPTHTGNRVSTGVYDIPKLFVSVKAVLTNTVPTGPYRGAGRPEAIYRLERLIDVAAAEIGFDPVELRRRNLVSKEQMPYVTAAGSTYDSSNFQALIDRAIQLSEPENIEQRRNNARSRNMLFGRGLACHIDTTSSLVPSESVTITYSHNGMVEIFSGTQAMGQGLETSFAQMAAARLSLPIETINVLQGDTSVVMQKGHGSYGSRSLYLGGSALALALDQLVENAILQLAEYLNINSSDIDEQGGILTLRSTGQQFTLARLIAETGLPKIEATRTFESVNCYPSGCYICEVEIDAETGSLNVVKFVAVDDVGTVMHPTIVHGQTSGGLVQGISQAILEQTYYNENGQLLSGSFMDYTMPRAADIPDLTIDFMPTPSPTNPLGAKGGGESGAIGAPAAVVNAVMDALRSYGVRHLDMPITSQSVWRIICGGVHK